MAKGLIEYLRGPKSTWYPSKRANSTNVAYWLNWRAYLSYIWIITSMVMSLYFIIKYERLNSRRSRNGEEEEDDDNDYGRASYEDEAWKPSLKKIHPAWLMTYRIFAFLFLLFVLIQNVIANDGTIFYNYTEWTYTSVLIYFGFGSLLSMYGCYRYHIGPEDPRNRHQVARFWGYIFQIIFQMVAGAVVLTDCVFWFIIVPYLSKRHHNIFHLLPIAMHSINVVFLLGDVLLNSLRFPWFRVAYFSLWTCVYVIFQWTLNACTGVGWPYPFLDFSYPLSPLWYVLVALLHIPCYGIFFLIMKLKHFVLMKWFPNSN